MLIATLSCSKFVIIPLQREEFAARSNASRRVFFVSAEGIDTALHLNNFFLRDTKPSFGNTSRPKPQTT